ncbi:hypothetical protein BDV93DRAFT_557799 [Ceratobasidium sp. AG-I]|nr:hypothetical protein BDV93DRAFT_557799 [Ceratobasidium sp. AG-I]
MAKAPTKQKVLIRDVIDKYGASNLIADVAKFLGRRCGTPSHDALISHNNYVDVWHKLYLHHEPLPFAPFEPLRRDVVRASPPVLNKRGRICERGIWDVALYLERPNMLRERSGANEDNKHGMQHFRACRVRSFFTLPAHLKYLWPGQLAYVEVFVPFDSPTSQSNQMHSTKPDLDSRNQRRTLVIPVSDIVLSCHLAPKFHQLNKDTRLSIDTDLLSSGKEFWLNHYVNHYLFQLVEYWRRRRPGLRDWLARNLRHVRWDL